MAKTYAELTQKINQLQAQAEARRLSEAKGVVRTINEAIATYGLTAADLKFAQTVPTLVASPQTQPAMEPKSAGSAVVKSGGKGYSDSAGNTWTGRGPRPKWLREALVTGGSLSKYAVTSSPKARSPIKCKLPAKYRNVGTGEEWTGRGSKPGWLRRAIDSGRDIAEFEVSNGKSVGAALSLALAPTAASAKKVTPKSALAKKAAPVSVSAKKAVPAKKLASASVPEKKAAVAVKASSKKAVSASQLAKSASVSAKTAKTERAPAKSASALQAITAQAHVPVATGRIFNDGAATAASTTVPVTADLVPVQPK